MLLRTLKQLHEQCERYLGFQSKTLEYHARNQDEHSALLEALRKKDLTKADEILNHHIKEAGEMLVDYFSRHD